MIVAFLVALPLLIFISLSVFGGGQVFMPVFKWLWELLANTFGAEISQETINHVFTVSNATPGVVSTKFAFFTGYLVSNGEWWGFLAMFVTYLFFTIPALVVIVISMKYVNKFENTIIMQKILLYMKPVVAGIIIAIAVQLVIGLMFPFLIFNDSSAYVGIDEIREQAVFFSGWRRIVLLVYFPITVIISYFLYRKKISLFFIIFGSTILALIVFMPWL